MADSHERYPTRNSGVDNTLSRLREQHWFRAASPGRLIDQLLSAERSRLRRCAIWFGIPALLLCVAATYATTIHLHSFPIEVEMQLDGREIPSSSVRALVRDGRILPITVRVPGHGTVRLDVEVPENVDPNQLKGMRLRTHLVSEQRD